MAVERGPVLRAEGVGYRYPDGSAVLAGVDLAVRPREIVALVGASGCGKSTLLRVLAGLAPAGAGAVTMLDTPLSAAHPRSALLFQRPSLLPWLTVRRNVAFGLDFARQPVLAPSDRDARVAKALAAVGLADRARAFPAQLSGGQAQRVALARALAREPAVLFADEPFSALDAVTRAQMQDLLVAVVRRWGSAVLLVTHDIDEAVRVADRVLLLAGGRIAQAWTARDAAPDALATDIHLTLRRTGARGADFSQGVPA